MIIDMIVPVPHSDYQQKRMCFAALQPWWVKILQIFNAALAEGNSQNLAIDKLELSLGEFLSLMVETLRHTAPQVNTTGAAMAMESMIQEPKLDAESATSSHTHADPDILPFSSNSENDDRLTQYNHFLTSCQMSVICCIPKLALLMQSCSSIFVLRRVLDICLRAVELSPPSFEVKTHLKSSLPVILQSQLLKQVLHLWMQQTGIELLNSTLGRSQLESAQNVSHTDHQIDTGLVNAVVRKLVLLLLKIAASIMKRNGTFICFVYTRFRVTNYRQA